MGSCSSLSTLKIHLRGKMNQAPKTLAMEPFHESFPLERRGQEEDRGEKGEAITSPSLQPSSAIKAEKGPTHCGFPAGEGTSSAAPTGPHRGPFQAERWPPRQNQPREMLPFSAHSR